jgi:dihydroorotate dehydrogenase electron transfer subunit
VGLIALDASPARLKGLIRPALQQAAAVVLVCASAPDNLSDEVEVQPLSAVREVVEWADYLAFDVPREYLPEMKEQLSNGNASIKWHSNQAQVLLHTPVPCGGLAECGVCAITIRRGWKLACKDGPVFDWTELG